MFRVTAFFQQANYGWTETLWDNSVSTNAALTHYQNDMLIPRQAILDPSAQLVRLRASDPDVPRSVTILDYPTGSVPGTYLSTVGAETFAALLCAIFTITDHRRNYLLRGIPEEIILPPDGYNATSKWITSFAQWALAIGDGTWAARVRFPVGDTPFVPLTAIAIGPSPYQLQITTAAPLQALGTPPVVQLKGVQMPYDVNGVYRAMPGTGANTYILGPRRYRPFNILPAWNGSGEAQALAYTAVPFQTVETVRIVKKSTGRPFGLPVGRRRPVR